jgi:hypothetical protein
MFMSGRSRLPLRASAHCWIRLLQPDDRFWPHENWPGVKFDLPLQVGATGGHGTGPYTVSSYTPGRHIRFEFGGGRQGYHEFTFKKLTT